MGVLTADHPDQADARRDLPGVSELIDLAQEGDLHAFGDLIRGHERRVFAITFSVCRDRAAAEDLAQEAFVAAYRSLQRLREKERFSSWLAGIAYRKARAWRVRRAVRRAIWDRWFVRPVSPGPDDPADAASRQEATAQAIKAIRELPEVERLAVVLRIQQGIHTPEIARMLGITPEQARRAFERGLAALRRQVGGKQ